MLLEDLLPEFHAAEVHETTIPSAPAGLYDIVRHLDFSASFVIRTLFSLRGLPTQRMTLDALLGGRAFTLLAEGPDEFVLGGMGRPGGGLVPIPDASAFRSANGRGLMKVAWSFSLHRDPAGAAPGSVLVRTETRVLCMDRRARLLFGAYWMVVRPFSGLIRLEMLRIIRKQALGSLAKGA